MSPSRTPPHLLTLILLTGFSPLSLNMFMPSLANIATDLATDYSKASLAVSGYLALTATIQLIIGPLSDRIGRRPVLLGAVFVFACASVGCVFAQDITTFLIFRMLQGGVAAGFTLSLAIVRDTRTEEQAVSLIGYIGMSMAIAPMLGPMLGGLLDTLFGWRSVFVFYAVSGWILFVLSWIDVGETWPNTTKDRTAPAAKPTALLAEPLFWCFSLCGAFSIGGFFIFITGAPLIAVSVFDLTTAQVGLGIGSITFGFMVGGFIAGRFGRIMGPTTLLIAGRVSACMGASLGLVVLSLGVSSPQLFFACTVFVGLGNGLTIPASNTGAMSVKPELAGSAAGLNAAVIQGTGAVLTAITGRIVTQSSTAETVLILLLSASCISLCCAICAAKLRPLRIVQQTAES